MTPTLPSGAILKLEDYETTESGVVLIFACANPGPNMDTQYTLSLTAAQVNTVSTGAEFDALVAPLLKRKYQRQGLATRLNHALGRTITL